MPRLNTVPPSEILARRRAFADAIEGGGLPVAEAIRRMRHALGMTQARFAATFKLTPGQVWELENGTANPTLETLDRLGRPFGFVGGFVSRHATGDASTGDVPDR